MKKLPLLRRYAALNYNWKITIVLMAMLFVIAILILLTASFSAGRTIKDRSAQLTMAQLESITNVVETTLGDFGDVATYIISDNRVQDFLRGGSGPEDNATQRTNNAYHLLTYLMNSNSYLDHVAIYRYADEALLYQGEVWTIPDFKERMIAGSREEGGAGHGRMRLRIEPSLFSPQRYSINLRQPIYDHYNLETENGCLLISINHEKFSDIYAVKTAGQPLDIYLTDAAGQIVSSGNQGQIGKASPLAGEILGDRGSVEAGGDLIVYRRLDQWDWYVAGTISMDDLLRDNRETMGLLAVLIFVICAACALVALPMSNRLYRPLQELAAGMARVSEGDLSARMDSKNRGRDIRQLADGFNHMLDEIEGLMVRVGEEQRQLEQIKYSALQSQIKPHFLYNTLECIHWQAAVDGNREVSTMVKALASYYRICLSKGQDLIPISQEIAHVKSYLTIQNMRYDGIVDAHYQVPESLGGVAIPKMTLQPLVENAIYHGIKRRAGKRGRITIRALEEGEGVLLLVEDTGIGMDEARIAEINNSISVHDEGFGYGVRNVHKRIQLIFGRGYGLFYAKNEAGGLTVEIRLPNTRPL